MTPVDVADEIVAAVVILARHRFGALILWDPAAVGGGVLVDGIVTRELLTAIFIPEYVNRLHRGAVVILGDRVERARVPLAWADVVGRAAQLAAGVAILVDTDTGEIRVAHGTGRVEVVEPSALADVLRGHALEVVAR